MAQLWIQGVPSLLKLTANPAAMFVKYASATVGSCKRCAVLSSFLNLTKTILRTDLDQPLAAVPSIE
jgi:hypothetical protein